MEYAFKGKTMTRKAENMRKYRAADPEKYAAQSRAAKRRLRKIRAAAEAWQKDRIETQDGEYDHLNTCEFALIEALK